MTESIASKKKRVAKNTILLYVRMLFSMLIGLYTSRIVLKQLGIDDFGVYNVVGGVVTMFSIVSASMTSAIGRFITFELETGNISKLKRIFSSAVTIQLLLGLLVTLLIETVGVWFLNNKMNIAPDRMGAANWVLQFSTVTFIVNMISVPYNASIIAHEKMAAFAYISILEVILKLGVAFLLYVTYFDSLIWYACLIMMVSIIIRLTYSVYCDKHFEECRFSLCFDREIYMSMLGFSGWNFIGLTSSILRDQGVNIILNLFCGSGVNAARGVATQVNNAIYGFSSNFMLAMNPQIIKSYASGERDYMNTLIIQGARLSLYMLMFFSLPIILEAPKLLALWLVDIPPYAIGFTRLVLVVTMIESLSLPLLYANQATGRIRNYQIIVGGIQLLNLPFSYLFLKLGNEPDVVYLVAIILGSLGLVARLIILHHTIDLPAMLFVRKVIVNGLIVSLISVSIPYLLYVALRDSWVNFFIVIITSWIWSAMVFYRIGCNSHERNKIKDFLASVMYKIKHNHAGA